MSPLMIPRGHNVGASGLPVATVPAQQREFEEVAGEELARLEALLAERASELAGERAEHGRLRVLLRDSLERFSAPPPPSRDLVELATLRTQHRHAIDRALEAEAARAEITFQLDEVTGHLLAAGSAERPAQDEAASITQARLAGTVRGLISALAESEEARDMASARRMLVEHDLDDSRERVTQLSRALVEAREQAEFAEVQTRVLAARMEGALDARAAGRLRGETLGASARVDEAERALRQLSSDLGASRALAAEPPAELQLELAEARAELAVLRADSALERGRIPELERTLAREIEGSREAKAELARRQAECLVLNDELTRARNEALNARALADELRAAQLRAQDDAELERLSAQQTAAERQAGSERMGNALREVRALLGELPPAVGRAITADPLASRDPTLPGTVSAFEATTVTSLEALPGSDDALHNLEARVTEAIRVLRALQDGPGNSDLRGEVAALLRLLELA